MGGVSGERHKMAAVLHDVIEDTPVTADDLVAAGCPDEVVAAVVALSKSPDEPSEQYLARVAANPMAMAVKRADIADNLSDDRLGRLDAATQERLRAKYARAVAMLDAYESSSANNRLGAT
jgi:(p)ppGpp synthase/HD superfamily hydrolase